jgi:hypothetical protein
MSSKGWCFTWGVAIGVLGYWLYQRMMENG